ncbi:class I adenylate-forming enzyme family protein [Phytoactinopolyspora mesophila]|nr:class I adenylate-forming enzyme family protein [Phytoactinopolyspora mesophila]
MGFADRLAGAVAAPPAHADALVHQDGWWTWGHMRALMAATEDFLQAAGCGSQQRVGIVLDNKPEHIAAALAVLSSGRCLVSLSAIQPPPALATSLTHARLPVVLASPATLWDTRVTEAIRATGTRYGALLADGNVVPGPAAHPQPNPAPEHAPPGATIEISSSGTTGPPRTITLHERQVEASLAASGQYKTTDQNGMAAPRPTTVIAHPISHIAGLWALLGAVVSGRRIVLMPRFHVDDWVAAVHRHRVHTAFLVPAALRSILDARPPTDHLSSLALINTGASHCPPEVTRGFWDHYGIPVLTTYGTTEFAGAIAGWTRQLHADWVRSKAGSAGRAYPGVELRVSDAAGTVLPRGWVGRLEVRSDQAQPGTSSWTRTNDLARIDADGFLWIAGRADAVIQRGGFKIQPERIEQVLQRHPGVREATVIGMPDERVGAVPVAAIEPEPHAEPPTEQELLDACRSNLAPYEQPRDIVFFDLPRTPSGKIIRADVADRVREAQQIRDDAAS